MRELQGSKFGKKEQAALMYSLLSVKYNLGEKAKPKYKADKNKRKAAKAARKARKR